MINHKKHNDIGVIGLGVMGRNLALNMVDNHYCLSVFDLDLVKIDDLLQQEKQDRHGASTCIQCCSNLQEMLESLHKPRIIVVSVPAGEPVDQVCHALLAAGLEADDIVIDTGNSLWTDTVERDLRYQGKLRFFSSAISGGEAGARFGPCLMPSGNIDAWQHVAPIWQAIAAKVDPTTGLPVARTAPDQPLTTGEPCAAYIGPAGAGHYVKMVHNGIEYADMQLICEAYHVLHQGLGLAAAEVGQVFAQWNTGILNSYLMEISAEVLSQVDPLTNTPLVDMILDKAGQKGTGLWTAVSSLQMGCAAPTIAEAVYARGLSTQKELRVKLSQVISGPEKATIDASQKTQVIEALEQALYCAKVSSYAQGFQLMAMTASAQQWQLDFAGIAKIWRAGCIIRAAFLQSIAIAYEANTELPHLFMAEHFAKQLSEKQSYWRKTVASAVMQGIPIPCISSALAYYDSYRTAVLPANLLQGQRDFFGAHTFERTDAAKGQKFHLHWHATPRRLSKL